MELAELKYDCCNYDDVPQKTVLLKEIMKGVKRLNALDVELLLKCAEYITVSHNATIGLELILSAINEYYDCKENIKELLKSNVEQAIAGVCIKETKEIQHRLREIDDARNDYINLIASGVMDEEAMDEQFQKLYAEEQELNSRLKYLEENNNINDDQKSRISQALQIIDNSSCELAEYKDMLIRKLIECVKVNSKTEITIIFKGGYEVTAEVEK